MRGFGFNRRAILAFAVAGIAGCGGASIAGQSATPGAGKSPAVGGEVSDFSLKDVDGRTHRLSDHLGSRVVLMSFWATWCEPCKKEMVQLQSLFQDHADEGLMIFSISMDEPETQGDVRQYVKQRGFTYPVLLDTESQVTSRFNPRRAAPYSLIIGRDRRIAWSHEGYVPGDEAEIERAVATALAAGR